MKKVIPSTIIVDRCKLLEEENVALRRRLVEFEAQHNTSNTTTTANGTDINNLIVRTIAEHIKAAPNDAISTLTTRISQLETELTKYKSATDVERNEWIQKQHAITEQLAKYNTLEEQIAEKNEQVTNTKRELRTATETLDRLTETEKRLKDDNERESQKATQLQTELVAARKERLDTIQKLHDKYTTKLQELEKQLATTNSGNDVTTKFASINDKLDDITSILVTKEDMKGLITAMDSTDKQNAETSRSDALVAINNLDTYRLAIWRLAEEYGHPNEDASDLIGELTKAIKGTVRAYEQRLIQEKMIRDQERMKHETEIKDLKDAQDALLKSMEHLMEQMNGFVKK